MRYLKMLGLATVAVSAVMAFAGQASATELTCNGVRCAVGATLHAVSEGKTVIDSPTGTIECNTTFDGHIEEPGNSVATASGAFTSWSFTNCGGATVTVLALGSFIIHTTVTGTANNNGTLTSTGLRITIVNLGVHCIFETNATALFKITGGKTATLHDEGTLPRVGGSGGVFCGSTALTTGSMTVEQPDSFVVH